MKKNSLFKNLVGAAVAITALLHIAAPASAADALARVKAAGELKIGTETAFAPFDFMDMKGAHTGFNVDLFAELGKELGLKITWIALPFEGLLPSLESGKFDMMAGPIMVTKARMERYRFMPPVAEATVGLLKRTSDKSITKPEDVAGKTVGGGKASAQLAQLKAFTDKLPGKTTIREYVGNNEAYADLAAGRIVGVGNSLPNITYVANQRPEVFEVVQPPFGDPAYFAYLGRKNAEDAPLLDALQATLLKFKADGRLATLQKKWFGRTFETPDLVTAPNL